MLRLGDEVQLSRDRVGVVRYYGTVPNKSGDWYDIELIPHRSTTKDHQNRTILIGPHRILYFLKRN